MEPTLFANLRAIIWRNRLRLSGAFLMLLTSNLLQIFNPLLFRQALIAVDPAAGKLQGFFSEAIIWLFGRHLTSVWVWGAVLTSIAVVSASLKYFMRLAFFTVGRDAERDMRSLIFERIQSQSQEFFDRHGTGELLSRLTNDISSYRDVLGAGLMYPLFFLTIVFPALAALMTISVKLTLVSIIPMAAIPLFNAAVRGRIFKLSMTVQKKLADLSNLSQEHYTGIRIVKCYVMENVLSKLFARSCRELVHSNFRLAAFLGIIYPFFTMLTKLVTILLVLFCGFIILNAWGHLSTADFISFIWIQSYIFFPILMIGWILPMYERGRAAYARFVEIYHEPIEVREGKETQLKIPPKAEISFKNLTFKYPVAERNALSGITLDIKGGSFVGITGPIGSGKSTLFHLLNREYEIPRGMIFIDGHDIKDYTFEALREAFVTVEQSPFLFSKTIAENVRFGMEEATQKDLEMVAQYADLHETVMAFPEKYETVIGERGVTLSGGQKQRIAMARAFLVERSIFLLDDIFSAVDASTEKRIFEIIKGRYSGKTVLMITHRVSILEQMDRVIYMRNGAVMEDGAPKELRERGGVYAALAELQTL